MRTGSDQQSLSYPLRLPDTVQANALRLLDVSRLVINATVAALWPQLDEFGKRDTTYAYKEVTAMIGSSHPHGDRQWRCEAEQAGRILRGQAERKKQFALILPILEQGMIQPKTETRRAGKNRKAIKQALADLREETSDGGRAVELQSLLEQACNFYLTCFPGTYEQMQAIPVLKTGILPYAGDDGRTSDPQNAYGSPKVSTCALSRSGDRKRLDFQETSASRWMPCLTRLGPHRPISLNNSHTLTHRVFVWECLADLLPVESSLDSQNQKATVRGFEPPAFSSAGRRSIH